MCAQHREVSAVPPARPDDHPAAGVVTQWRGRHGHPAGADALGPTHGTAAQNRHPKGRWRVLLQHSCSKGVGPREKTLRRALD